MRSLVPEPENPYFPEMLTKEETQFENIIKWDSEKVQLIKEKSNNLKRFAWEVDLGIEGEATKVKDIKFSHDDLPYYLWEGTSWNGGETSTQESTASFDRETFWKEYRKKIDLMKKWEMKSMSIDQG